MIAAERETSIAYSAEDVVVRVYTCIRKDINAMKKKSQFKLVEEGEYADGTLWANFEIPIDRFDIARAAKGTRNHTPESRQKAAEALKQYRESKNQEVNE